SYFSRQRFSSQLRTGATPVTKRSVSAALVHTVLVVAAAHAALEPLTPELMVEVSPGRRAKGRPIAGPAAPGGACDSSFRHIDDGRLGELLEPLQAQPDTETGLLCA